MSLFRQIVRGARTLLRRPAADRDIADEVEHFLEEEILELVGRGVSPEEARRRVRLKYGDVDTVREEVRSYGWENAVDSLLRDLRFAIRRLRADPGFTAVAVLTLGLGIGSATAIFSAVRPILVDPLPLPEADRVVTVADRGADGAAIPVSFGAFLELRDRSRSFDALAVVRPWGPSLVGDHEPERLEGRWVSQSYFTVLGVEPARGRGLTADADRPGGAEEVLLSHGLWIRRFGGDAEVVGRTVRLDDVPHVVRGVLPPDFEDPLAPGAEVWSLLQYDPAPEGFDVREWGHHLQMIGRLGPEASREAARAELATIAASPRPERPRPPWGTMDDGLVLRGLRDTVTAPLRPTTLALAGAALLLLLIACVNVTHLLLARGAARRAEIAMRLALGAGRGRVVRQLVTEAWTLAALGGALGVGLAWTGTRALARVAPVGLEPAGLDGPVLAFALALSAVVGSAVGILPALGRGVGPEDLRRGSRASSNVGGVRRTLVVAEVALALMLLVGAGLLVRSVDRLLSIPPGFDPGGALIVQVQASGDAVADRPTLERFFARSLDRVRALPRVTSAAFTGQLPLSGEVEQYGLSLPEEEGSGAGGVAFPYAVSPGYLETMGIPLLRGRTLESADPAGALAVAVVSESLARRRFGGVDPIGREIHVGRPDLPPYTIVGVVGDVTQESLGATDPQGVYIAARQWYVPERARWLVVRTSSPPLDLVAQVKAAIWSVDPNQPIVTVSSLDSIVARSEARRRFARDVLRAFAVLALLLAGIGLYGVLTAYVNDRRREIGLRSALGAPAPRIVGLIMRQGMSLTGIGVAIGLTGAALGSRALTSLLFGVSRLDPITYASVAVLVVSVGLLACWRPASRAAGVDPVRTLRTD